MAKKITLGTILGMLGILVGLIYILFPDFFINYGWNLRLQEKGLIILGIIVIVISFISILLNIISKGYKRLVRKHGKIFLLIYIFNWVITIFLVLALGNTMNAVVQSVIP